jgi:outer membrane biosynthesis protein TonB
MAEPSPEANASGSAAGDTADSAPVASQGSGSSTPSSPATDAASGTDRDLSNIQKIVADNRKPVRACYEKARKELPDLQGTLTITFVLDPNGAVKSAEPNQERSDIKNPDLVKCAIDVIKSLSFPKSPKGMETTVNYPYNFKP